MGCLLIPVVVASLAFADILIMRLFQQRRAGPVWWTLLSIAWLAGAVAGVWSGFFFEYQPSPRLRVFGAPVPAAFFHLEGPPGQEEWIDFITPAPLLFAGSNIVILGLAAACLIGLVFWVWQARPRDKVTATPTRLGW